MNLSAAEIQIILFALQHKYGSGYSDAEENGVQIAQLQAKLSMMAEAKHAAEKMAK